MPETSKGQTADSSKQQKSVLCGIEAAALLNCVTEKQYDQSQCIKLLEDLRNCVKKNVG